MGRRLKTEDPSAPQTSTPTASEPQSQPEPSTPAPDREAEIRKLQADAIERTRTAAREGAQLIAKAFGPNPADEGETVSYTWGEELFSPKQFFTCRVGPFTDTTKVRAGETRNDARLRLREEMSAFAEAERKRKFTTFLDTMDELFGEMKKRNVPVGGA